MQKIIVVIKKDSGVILIWPNPTIYGDDLIPYSECKVLQRYIDPNHSEFVGEVLEYAVIEPSELPTTEEKKGMESREQLFWNAAKKRVEIDKSWKKRLMPKRLILKKETASLSANVTSELEKSEPDILTIFKANQKIEKMSGRDFTDKEVYQIALDGLANRSEADKKDIKKKLETLIASL